MHEVLKKIKPKLIISAVRGPFEDQIDLHQQLIEHVKLYNCRLLFLSSSNVFDAFHNYPSYEFDKTLSESVYGRLKIKIENDIMRLAPSKYVIARLPMVYGLHAPRIKEIEALMDEKLPLEVFPNTIVNLISDRKLTQQIHYIINQKLTGIFQLGTTDLITHYDLQTTGGKAWLGPIEASIYHQRHVQSCFTQREQPAHLLPTCEDVLEDHLPL